MTGPRPRAGLQRIAPHMLEASGAAVPALANLASNESALGPSPRALEAARAALAGAERYPEEAPRCLAEALAARWALDPAGIALGHGSDDILARLARAYLEPGSELVHSRNGYPKFANYAHANDARPVGAPDEDLRASLAGILDSVTERTRAVFLANPDNPSGSHLSGTEVRALHGGLPGHVLLVLDSAYAEYADAADYEPAERLVARAENVVMTRTFSKIFGLAGLRLGWLYAPPAIAEAVRRLGITFPVNTAAFAAGLAALADRDHVARVRAHNSRLRALAAAELGGLGLEVYPSQGNFVLVRFPDPARPAAAAHESLRRAGILTRRFAAPAYADCLRITLGLEREVTLVLEALRRFLGGAP